MKFRAGCNFPDIFFFFFFFLSHHKMLLLEIKAFSEKTAISKYVFGQKDRVPSRLKKYSEITIFKFHMEKGLQVLITSTENTGNV